MSALQRLQEFRFKKMQESTSARNEGQANVTSKALPSDVTPSSGGRGLGKEPAVIVLDSPDTELESQIDIDLRKGVKKMTTGSPLQGSPRPSTPSDRASSGDRSASVKAPSKLSDSISAKTNTPASKHQVKLPFKPVPASSQFTEENTLFDSDHSLSSPGQSDDDNVVMSESRGSNNSNSSGSHVQSAHSQTKRQIIVSDEDDTGGAKSRGRLFRKDEVGHDSTSEAPKRRRLVKRATLYSEEEADQTSGSGPVTIQISDDEFQNADSFDQTLAQLQSIFPDTPFKDLKKALDDSHGDFATAASKVVSRSSSQVLDLTPEFKKKVDLRKSLASSTLKKDGRPPHLPLKPAPSPSFPVKIKRTAHSSDDSDDSSDGGPNNYKSQDRKEERALQFFNKASAQDLQELTGCSESQANGVIGLRPFDNYDQLCVMLRNTKGVGEKIVNNYLTTSDAILAVDMMLTTVDQVREDLAATLNVWCGDEYGKIHEKATSSNSMEVIDKSKSDEFSATGGGNGDDYDSDGDDESEPGVELLDIDAEKVGQTEAGKEAMKGFISVQPSNMARGFKLKGYQLLGVNWLALLWRKGLSGILADEMGLGKTAQVIAFLAHLFENQENGPFLIIVPASTLSNWMREFEKFCPVLDVRAYYGKQKEREELRQELTDDDSYNVIVTTYAIATGNNDERKFLNRRRFKGIILDEGHMLKNCTSVRYKQLMSIKTDFRLLLTGTPLQNNLEELLSLLIFIMPKLFSEHEEVLRTMFKVKADAMSGKSTLLSQERIVRARHMIAPFVLRRKKTHVLKDLPQKVERIVYCDLHPAQRMLYDRIMSSSALQESLQDSTEDIPNVVELDGMDPQAKSRAIKKGSTKKTAVTSKRSANEFANILMQLRKAADHPMLFREMYTDDKLKTMAKAITNEPEFCDSNIKFVEEDMSVMTDFELHRLCKQYKSVKRFALPGDPWMKAGKVQELQRLLPKLIDEDKSRILIFSQFTMVLDILESILKTMNLKYLRMDGATKVEDRQPLIDSFNDDESHKVFLLSTKAGGFGINLTGANVVIMYDLDYNPHNDKQAEDRAHRVGQTREVEVIKLISKNTIEEQILQLANLKLKLDQHVSQDDSTATNKTSDSTSSSGSSTPSAGILSLIKRNLKAVNSSVVTQQDLVSRLDDAVNRRK